MIENNGFNRVSFPAPSSRLFEDGRARVVLLLRDGIALTGCGAKLLIRKDLPGIQPVPVFAHTAPHDYRKNLRERPANFVITMRRLGLSCGVEPRRCSTVYSVPLIHNYIRQINRNSVNLKSVLLLEGQ